ncbi:hypothetical protein PR048_033225 [Dryococelus australis]|uniref:Uncharacterized protein n=1 Tax=Dryococelus australis TaxID=614101 RepID=A0ABQ9FZP4_9NEOP|nr:hypothetical protein PR048_033225 [Dryococelus australis]
MEATPAGKKNKLLSLTVLMTIGHNSPIEVSKCFTSCQCCIGTIAWQCRLRTRIFCIFKLLTSVKASI